MLNSSLFLANTGGRVAAAIIANFFITFSFNGCYVWTSELYPTVIRYGSKEDFGHVLMFARIQCSVELVTKLQQPKTFLR